MESSNWIERRVNKGHDLTLRRSFLFHTSKRFAYRFLVAGFALAATADVQAPDSVWFGPIYLFLIAFSAWTVSGLLAVTLGVLALAINWTTSGFSLYPYGPESALANAALRFLSMLMIVGVLILARRSCEREWQLARADPLTGALNRQAFFEAVQASPDSDQWCALAFADVDGLKKFNDERGHGAGDRALQIFAASVKKAIRKGDLFARIGGDEFLVFMKINDINFVNQIAERLYSATCAKLNQTTSLPCSWGVLLLPPGPRQIDNEIRAADALMYQTKRTGAGFGLARYCPEKDVFEPFDGEILPHDGTVIRSKKRESV
ncbi:GGDEF domain-containing protein [Croceicoccus ponticola]|uniref:diguanylate cyclase n=1 Tax=Croceicoccus ponticola TaxID=2217664 RepID=A0A437GVY5_9SPHN|nr:GGDEF domain-containing protein [Croceicoccus ponticola]RVQ66034.1 GGDEF domain-containing protein [Croceicoccus ponticola]